MPNSWAAGLSIFVIVLGAGFAVQHYLKRRPTQAEIERLRRLSIHRKGKMGDGEIIDIEDLTIIYSYSIAGVGYTASQDATDLREKLPEDLTSMIGPIAIKFDPRNPANSIVFCEEWSGLRNRVAKSARPFA
jgi:hypothetical protein